MSSNSTSLGIDSLRQVLQLTFESNLNALKQHFPQFYKKFKDYKPEHYGLELDEKGNLNIAANGQFVYDRNPQELSKEQFELFFSAPTRSLYQLNINKDQDTTDMFAHIGLLKKLANLGNDAIEKSASKAKYDAPEFYPIMCVIGVGLGYHLEYMIEHDIGHLHIYEPNTDFFYASLFVVNYTALIQRFTEKNRRLSIVIGIEPENYIEELHRTLVEVGTYQAAMMPVIKHYDSERVNEALRRFWDAATNFYSGFGFVEDEIISINHTTKNIESNLPYVPATLNLSELSNKPVFICGAGPSLDTSIEFLKKHRDNITIFSGGSALPPLHKAGIVPDLHFEIERTEALYDWVSALGDEEYFKQVSLVTMNTVSPKVIGLFGAAYLYLKPNDGGTDLVRQTFGKKTDNVMMLYASNPTVTNAATAFAARTGFKELYFVGMDLGFKDEGYHHSKSSIYYKEDDESFNEKYKEVRGGLKSVEGNFGGEVLTTGVFDWARHSIEYVLRRPQYSDIKAYNCSDGAKIFRAEPTNINDVEITENDGESLAEYLKDHGLYNHFKVEEIKSSLKRSSEKLMVAFDFFADDKFVGVDMSVKDAMNLFQYQFVQAFHLMTKQDLFAGRVLIGSLNYLQSASTGKIYTIRDDAGRRDYIKQVMEIFPEYFSTMKGIYQQDVIEKLELNNVGSK